MNTNRLRSQQGFTILELAVSVVILGFLAVTALPLYLGYIPRAQAVEFFTMTEFERSYIFPYLVRGQCTKDGLDRSSQGRYGVLTTSGSGSVKKGKTCRTGCVLTYTFNSTGVHGELAGKVVVSELLIDGRFSKDAGATTAPQRYLPKLFEAIPVAAGEDCS